MEIRFWERLQQCRSTVSMIERVRRGGVDVIVKVEDPAI
jgi:hypothetical protein